MFPMDPGTPAEVRCDQAVATLAAMIKPSQQSEMLVKVSDIAAKTAALGPQVWEAATTGGSAAYCKRLLEEEPSERIGIALADVKSGTSGAMDLIRVARSKGDFPGKVPQLAHGPMFPALRSDALNHAEAACLQVAPNVFPSTVSPSAFSASKTILREESLLASLVQGTFTDWHLASMVHQWIQQDPKFCYGHTSGSEVTAKDRGAVMGSKGQEFMITTFLDTILGPWWAQISPWDPDGMGAICCKFKELTTNAISTEDINRFFQSHWQNCQRQFTSWLQGARQAPPSLGEFSPQLIEAYRTKAREAEVRIQVALAVAQQTPTKRDPKRVPSPPTVDTRKDDKRKRKEPAKDDKKKRAEGDRKHIPKEYYDQINKLINRPAGGQITEQVGEKQLRLCYKAMMPGGCSEPGCRFSHNLEFWASRGVTPEKLNEAVASTSN